MNRVQKYRGQHIETKEWVYGTGIVWIGDDYCAIPHTWNVTSKDYQIKLVKVILETVGEFTGLQDKNGKDIYEGDLLMYLSTNQSSMEVKFLDGCFVGEGPFLTHPLKDYFSAVDFQSIEVIGNIYEPR